METGRTGTGKFSYHISGSTLIYINFPSTWDELRATAVELIKNWENSENQITTNFLAFIANFDIRYCRWKLDTKFTPSKIHYIFS